jgi:hypothetical protein
MTTTMRYIIHRRTLTRDHDSCELVMGFSFHVLFFTVAWNGTGR